MACDNPADGHNILNADEAVPIHIAAQQFLIVGFLTDILTGKNTAESHDISNVYLTVAVHITLRDLGNRNLHAYRHIVGVGKAFAGRQGAFQGITAGGIAVVVVGIPGDDSLGGGAVAEGDLYRLGRSRSSTAVPYAAVMASGVVTPVM